MIITFANHKGGVGKTSLAVLLAECAIENDLPVKLYDLDGQKNFTNYIQLWRPDIIVDEQLPEKMTDSDALVVIDTPPGIGAETERAIQAAARVVIPVDTSLAALSGIQDIVGKHETANGKFVVVINKFERNLSYNQDIFKQLQDTFVTQRLRNPVPVLTLPYNNYITINLTQGRTWNSRMKQRTQEEFLPLLTAIMREE